MTEPTLEEKLRAVFGVYQAKLWNDDGPIIAEIASKKELFENVDDAINWLHETAKREGYIICPDCSGVLQRVLMSNKNEMNTIVRGENEN